MSIRQASYKDVDALLAMSNLCYPQDRNNPTVPLRLKKVLRKNACWVEEQDGVIVACILSDLSSGQPYVWSVCTSPSHRGKGFASALLQVFEQHYKSLGYKRPWLHVRVSNPAQKLYFDSGYRVAAFEKNIYGMDDHGLVMVKHI